MKSHLKKLAKFMAAVLALQVMGLTFIAPSQATTSAPDCNATAGTSTSFQISLQSNPIFYFDTAKSITAGYTQFIITNKTGATVTGFKARLERIWFYEPSGFRIKPLLIIFVRI